MIRVLACPAQDVLAPKLGSERADIYNLLNTVSGTYPVQYFAICGGAESNGTSNFRIISTGMFKPVPQAPAGVLTKLRFIAACSKLGSNVITKYPIDIIHHVAPWGYDSGVNPLFLLKRRVKKIIGPVQPRQTYGDITEETFGKSDPRWIESGMHATNAVSLKLLGQAMSVIHENTLRKADGIIYNSQSCKVAYEQLYSGTLRGKIAAVIPPGVETNRFTPNSHSDNQHGPRILSVGMLVRRKGIDTIIRAMPQILREFSDCILEVVGMGPSNEELHSLCKRISVEDNVRFVDWVPRNELVSYYQSCDIFVMTSVSETGVPSAVREAMACGKPPVVSSLPAILDHIHHNENGVIFQPNDSQELAERIVHLLSDERVRERIGHNARNYAVANFGYDELGNRLFNFYERIMER